MNPKEVAQYLGISVNKVYAKVHNRVIHSMGFQVYQMPSDTQSKRRIYLRQVIKSQNVLK